MTDQTPTKTYLLRYGAPVLVAVIGALIILIGSHKEIPAVGGFLMIGVGVIFILMDLLARIPFFSEAGRQNSR